MKPHHLLISAPPKRRPGSSLELVHEAGGSLTDRRRDSGARILIADDHALMLSVTAELLGKHHQVVGTVGDGQALLDAIGKLSPDVAVVDIGMPRMHGVEVARRVRSLRSRTRLVFLTVYEDAELVRCAMSAGAYGYVVKSHVMSDLPLAVAAALMGKQFISPCLRHIDLRQN
ncbi:MAG TPA: response regulator transcription factor [Terriglobales bacterium]|nr:response regulator transcription factor [Terriglobales bacterium]